MNYDPYRLHKWAYHLAKGKQCDSPGCNTFIGKGDPCAYIGQEVIDDDSVEGRARKNPGYLYFCKNCYESRPDLQDLWAEEEGQP